MGTGITWRQLHEHLRANGVTFTHQVGSHVHGRTAHGAEISTCDPNKPGYVSPNHLAEIGRIYGKNLHDTLVWMGRKPDGKSKLTRKRLTAAPTTKKRPIPPPPTHDATDLVVKLHATTDRICRSGPCRKVNEHQIEALTRIVTMLNNWHRRNDPKAAA